MTSFQMCLVCVPFGSKPHLVTYFSLTRLVQGPDLCELPGLVSPGPRFPAQGRSEGTSSVHDAYWYLGGGFLLPQGAPSCA